MKKIIIYLLSIIFILSENSIFAQTYYPDEKASSIKFTIKNMGMGTEGKLSGLEGEITFNPSDLKNSFFSVSADANTIDTDISVRDSSLKSKEYLNSLQFPRILFTSKQISAANKPGMYFVKGNLTIKGISKEISFPFSVTPKTDGIQLTGDMRVNRLDFKIGIGSMVLSNSLIVSINVFAKKV